MNLTGLVCPGISRAPAAVRFSQPTPCNQTNQSLIAENNRQPVFARTDNDDLGVLALGNFPGGLYTLPFQEVVIQPLIDDGLVSQTRNKLSRNGSKLPPNWIDLSLGQRVVSHMHDLQ